jgi:hypothetical protein
MSLPFLPITTEEYRAQVAATAAQPRPPPPPPKRPVGRPKRVLSANEVLSAATAAAGSSSQSGRQPGDPPPKKLRGSYTEWFCSPFIHDILREYDKDHRPALTVQRLKAKAKDNRFARLNHTTLIRWFDDQHKLRPQYQAWLDSGLENVRQNGFAAAFEEEPAVEAEITQTLLQMRGAGTAINSHIIRWVMRGVIELRTDERSRLRTLQLGSSFISAWACKTLKWSWRKATTTASKLPLDWEEQGLQMAMRIAATMEMKEVRQREQTNGCTQWTD